MGRQEKYAALKSWWSNESSAQEATMTIVSFALLKQSQSKIWKQECLVLGVPLIPHCTFSAAVRFISKGTNLSKAWLLENQYIPLFRVEKA